MKYLALVGFMTLYVAVLPVLLLYLVCNLTLRRWKQGAIATNVA